MFLCITKKKPCFWSFANCETGAGGWSQVDKWSQVDRWSLVDVWSLVAGGHSEKIKNFIKKALDNNILLVRGYKTPELYCQHDTIGTFYHFPSLQCVS